MTSGNKLNFKRAVNFSLSIILSVVFLLVAFHNVDFSKVLTIIAHSSLIYIFYFLIIQIFSHYLRAVRWKIIIHSVKKDAKVKNLFGALMVGYGVNCVLPRVGEVTRAVLVGKWEGLSRTALFGTVIVERVIDIISFALTIIISAYLYSDNLYSSFPWLKTSLIITLALMLLSIVFLALLIRYKEKFYSVFLKIFSRISSRGAAKSAHIFNMLTEGFASLKGAKNYFWTVVLTVGIMVLYAYSSYIGFFIIGMQNVKEVTFEMGWVLNSISSIGVAIPTPGGTGSYHTLAKNTLVLLYNFSDEIGFAYAFITHILSYILFILYALVIFFVLNKQNMNLIKVVEADIEE